MNRSELLIQGVKKSFSNKIILEEVSVNIPSGCVNILSGKNASGKSTLLNIIANMINADSGTIIFKTDENKMDVTDINYKKKLGYSSQEDMLIGEFNSFEYLQFICAIYDIPRQERTNKISHMLNIFFDDCSVLQQPISSLSTGTKKKISICSTMIHTPRILILDEPFESLDSDSQSILLKLIKNYSTSKSIILIATHNLDLFKSIESNNFLLKEGVLISNN